MTTQHTPYLLKVLSGSNAGALVRLKVGEVVIGKSMASDIILHDEHIADSHVRLKVDESSIVLEALTLPVQVDGQEIESTEYLLKPYQVVTLGGVDFFIADVRKPGRRTSPDKPTGGSPAAESAAADNLAALRTGTPHGEFSKGGAVPDKGKAGGLGRWNKTLFWLGLGVLLLANIIYFMPHLNRLAEVFGLRASAQQRAESVLQQLNNDGLTLTSDTDGRAVITGYVDTRDEKRDFMNRLMLAGGDVNYRIWARDDLVANAERVARALGMGDLRFRNLDEGRLAAHGYVSSEEDWARIKNNIMTDVSGIQAIEDVDVQTLLKRKEALVQFIDKKGLSSRVKVTIEDDRIKVEGELTQSELGRWGDLYKEFVELHGEGPVIVENLYDVRDRLKLVIRSVSVGETPFLVSKDGKKYMEGASLGNDYFIKKITPDHVLLSNNGIEIPIYYGVEDK